MSRVQQLPRILMTWGLLLLMVIVGGVRPSCICADGTLCLLCPKLLSASAALPSIGPGATSGSCSSKSCCREHAAMPALSKSVSVCELVGSTCDGRDCLVVQSASPMIVQTSDSPTSRLDRHVVPAMHATPQPALSRDLSRSTGVTHRVGPPPDLIVLFQRWLI